MYTVDSKVVEKLGLQNCCASVMFMWKTTYCLKFNNKYIKGNMFVDYQYQRHNCAYVLGNIKPPTQMI